MTTIAMMSLTQVGATLLAIITAVILGATASVVATLPDSIHGRRCFRDTMAAGSADVILAAMDTIKVRGRADLGVRGNVSSTRLLRNIPVRDLTHEVGRLFAPS